MSHPPTPSERPQQHPFSLEVHGETYEVRYRPAESDSGMFGANSNWRGPVWFPVNFALIGATASRRRGDWTLCGASGWPDDSSGTQLLSWSWVDDEQRSLVVSNYADAPAAARVHPPWDDLAERTWRLDDVLSGQVVVRDGTEIAAEGLCVRLAPWSFNVLAWTDEAGVGT